MIKQFTTLSGENCVLESVDSINMKTKKKPPVTSETAASNHLKTESLLFPGIPSNYWFIGLTMST